MGRVRVSGQGLESELSLGLRLGVGSGLGLGLGVGAVNECLVLRGSDGLGPGGGRGQRGKVEDDAPKALLTQGRVG